MVICITATTVVSTKIPDRTITPGSPVSTITDSSQAETLQDSSQADAVLQGSSQAAKPAPVPGAAATA